MSLNVVGYFFIAVTVLSCVPGLRIPKKQLKLQLVADIQKRVEGCWLLTGYRFESFLLSQASSINPELSRLVS